MSGRALFRAREIESALKAARNAGFEDVRVRIDPAGGMEVIVGKATTESPPPEELD